MKMSRFLTLFVLMSVSTSGEIQIFNMKPNGGSCKTPDMILLQCCFLGKGVYEFYETSSEQFKVLQFNKLWDSSLKIETLKNLKHVIIDETDLRCANFTGRFMVTLNSKGCGFHITKEDIPPPSNFTCPSNTVADSQLPSSQTMTRTRIDSQVAMRFTPDPETDEQQVAMRFTPDPETDEQQAAMPINPNPETIQLHLTWQDLGLEIRVILLSILVVMILILTFFLVWIRKFCTCWKRILCCYWCLDCCEDKVLFIRNTKTPDEKNYEQINLY
ncbi:uncharacterized protein LOC128228592 isoform X2 [Mya arenaria]|uniref:uncharacterized protein LOC128228592 isoform X2 n=1 Tax=Mya arenaria TaxID=6604 RepID=UPI0022E0AFD0|nr:uncharacterized protein LOC128228592 isoform X2 [Mya arenaria]